MSREYYKVRDGEGVVIAQYYRTSKPSKPDDWDGMWNVEAVESLNNEPIEWWDDQP